ncbi:hypothetical protein JCM21900_004930 [Sporobolomyces salmonicolor]
MASEDEFDALLDDDDFDVAAADLAESLVVTATQQPPQSQLPLPARAPAEPNPPQRPHAPPPPTLPATQLARPLAPPRPSQLPPASARPGAILRPPQPPPRKRQRVSTHGPGEEVHVLQEPLVHRSVGAAATGAGAGGARDPLDEDMPEVKLEPGGGGYLVEPQRGTTVVPKPKGRGEMPTSTPKATSAPPPRPAAPAPAAAPRLVSRAARVGMGTGTMQGMQAEEGSGGRVGNGRGQAGAATGGMSDDEKRELEALRVEKAKLQAALEASRAQHDKLSTELQTKSGENTIVRNKLNKAEAAHAIALKQEQRDKQQLREQLERKEKEHRTQLDQMKMEEAFRRQEMATTSSVRKSSQRPGPLQRSAVRSGSMPPSAMPQGYAASPSLSRSRGGRATSSRPPPIPQPSFGGSFQNSFALDSPAPPRSSSRRPRRGGGEREGSMAPPPFPTTLGAKDPQGRRKSEKDRGREMDKGKGRMLLQEDESFFSVGHGGGEEQDLGGMGEVTFDEGEEGAEGEWGQDWSWEWIEEERGFRAEILCAVFTHTTFSPIDTTSSLPSNQLTHAHHHLHRSTAPATASTFVASRTFTAPSTHRPAGCSSRSLLSVQPSLATPTAPTGPIPTFHALTNLRFPPSTPPALVTEYECLTRELFSLLGRRLDSHPPSHRHPSQLLLHYSSTGNSNWDALLLAAALCASFEALLRVLDRAALVGPLTALLSLLGHLTFLFPVFSKALLNDPSVALAAAATGCAGPTPSRVIPLVARVVARYARPPPPVRTPVAGFPAPGVDPRRALSFRSRRAKVSRPPPAAAAAGESRKTDEIEAERIALLDGRKRGALVEAALEVLEGCAWRLGLGEGEGAGEEQFLAFLKAPNAVATLLDPNHPVEILLSSVRLLSLLACTSTFFRPLLAVKFYDASDVRNSKLPILDRIASLLVGPQPESSLVHDLDLSLVTLATLLVTKHQDAIMLVAQSQAFIPEVLAKLFRDVRTIWEWDGRDVGAGGQAREMLNRTTHRLSSLVGLFYYLTCAPHSSLTIGEYLAPSSAYQYQAVHDLFTVAFGTLGFSGGPPSWAEEGSDEGARLIELGYLAQEIMEDVSPDELEEIECCFGSPDDDEYDPEEPDAAAQDGDGNETMRLAGEDEAVLRDREKGR